MTKNLIPLEFHERQQLIEIRVPKTAAQETKLRDKSNVIEYPPIFQHVKHTHIAGQFEWQFKGKSVLHNKPWLSSKLMLVSNICSTRVFRAPNLDLHSSYILTIYHHVIITGSDYQQNCLRARHLPSTTSSLSSPANHRLSRTKKLKPIGAHVSNTQNRIGYGIISNEQQRSNKNVSILVGLEI